MRIKLSKYAKNNGISYITAYRYFMKGELKGIQMPSGTILIDEETTNNALINNIKVVLYARVSSSENKDNLLSQMERLRLYAVAKGYTVVDEVMEIGSGLNDKRKKLTDLLSNSNKWDKIIVEHKDRFTRFGFNYIQLLLNKDNKTIEIINDVLDEKEDIMQDFVSIVTCFCSKLYGLRRTRRKTENIIKTLTSNIE